jgi:hypothetical protein
MKKLLFLVSEDWFFVSHFLPMARAAKADGFEVVVATRVNAHGERIAAEGCRVIPFDIERGSIAPPEIFRGLSRAYCIERDERPDIVHCIAVRMIILGGIPARLAGARALVLAPTGLGHLWISIRPLDRLMRLVFDSFLALYCVASARTTCSRMPTTRQSSAYARPIRWSRSWLAPASIRRGFPNSLSRLHRQLRSPCLAHAADQGAWPKWSRRSARHGGSVHRSSLTSTAGLIPPIRRRSRRRICCGGPPNLESDGTAWRRRKQAIPRAPDRRHRAESRQRTLSFGHGGLTRAEHLANKRRGVICLRDLAGAASATFSKLADREAGAP